MIGELRSQHALAVVYTFRTFIPAFVGDSWFVLVADPNAVDAHLISTLSCKNCITKAVKRLIAS